MSDFLAEKISRSDFGKAVGVSRQTVDGLIDREILSASDTFGNWLLAYCDHLREVAAGRYAGGQLNLAQERAALAAVQREKIEMQNAVTRGELVSMSVLEEILSKVGARSTKILEALPAKLKRSVPGWTSKMTEIARNEVASVCNGISQMSINTLNDDVDQDD